MAFLLEIITPERQAYEETVESITVPTVDGYIGVMAHHIPLFTLLDDGEIRITQKDKELYLAIGGGFMEVTRDRVSILVTRAAHADELNEVEIQKAEKAAREIIGKRVRGAELAAAQATLRRSILEMKVLKHRRRRSSLVN